jgi:hypothetical protein
MKTLRNIFFGLWFISISSCAAHSVSTIYPVSENEVAKLIAESPHVARLSDNKFESRTSPEAVQFFYYRFGLFTEPSLIKNWKYHYVLEPSSSPVWAYEKLARVTVYLQKRDDAQAYRQYRQVASAMGGDGVIDMHRKPIITQRPPAPIAAYLYYGVVVRNSDRK